jgi:hypothetical protein
MELKNELETIIKISLNDLIREFKEESFTQEEEVQWFLQYLLKHRINELLKRDVGAKLVSREWPTISKFVRVEDKLEKITKRGRPGLIDIVIFDPGATEKKVLIGIEVERPRGSGQTNEDFFKDHIINDSTKLNDLGEEVDKYLLCFVCRPRKYTGTKPIQKPPFDLKSIWETELEKYCIGINFICVEFLGGKVINTIISPSDWIKLR